MRANTKNMEKIIADVTESPSKPSFSAGCATIWQTGGVYTLVILCVSWWSMCFWARK